MEPRDAWNAGAEAWLAFVRSGADYYRLLVHGPALLERCLPVAGLRVLDLGCGEGYFSRELARQGAEVTGVDLSDSMLAYAIEQEKTDPLGIDYRLLDAREIATVWDDGSFDLVTGCMSIQDMSDAAGVLDASARVLRPDGRMVFSVPNPCSDMPVRSWDRDERGEKLALRVDRYFDTGPAVMDWNMPRLASPWVTPFWRRTLEEWTELTSAAGFVIHRLYEPRPAPQTVREHPELDDCSRIPYFLIFDLRRTVE